ncbi:MAG: hypothetical protein JXB04_12550 [Kiritimatiellae bacterium]|nr:hypothetical protein [Kiritimatiellia bacterium]
MAARRAKSGSGSHPQTLRERTRRYGSPDLARLLGDVPFVVVGGLATRLYMPERMTLDADILVNPERLTDAEQALDRAGCEKLGPLTVGGSTWRLPDRTTLDVLAPSDPWVAAAIESAVRDDDGLPYAALPFLVLMKLASGRVQDLADITRMMGAADGDSLRRTREQVQRWRPQDAEDLESMIRLGRLEYQA